MACGRWDLEASSRAFWLRRILGAQLTAEEEQDLHPLRRKPAPPPTAEEVEEARQVGWESFEQGLADLNRQRG